MDVPQLIVKELSEGALNGCAIVLLLHGDGLESFKRYLIIFVNHLHLSIIIARAMLVTAVGSQYFGQGRILEHYLLSLVVKEEDAGGEELQNVKPLSLHILCTIDFLKK